MQVALQDHFSRTLQLPGGPKRMPTQLPVSTATALLSQQRLQLLKRVTTHHANHMQQTFVM
jgi:hypothetical protein